MARAVSAAKILDPSGKAAVTVTEISDPVSSPRAGSRLKLTAVGGASRSVMVTVASDTLKPAARPDTVRLSSLSPATPSSVPLNRNEADPFLLPPGIVTVKSFTVL